jgi:hypothetical protein
VTTISFEERVAQDRRRFILEALNEATGYQLNDLTLKSVLAGFGHTAGRTTVRRDLEWLRHSRLVKIEKLGGDDGGAIADSPSVWLATLTETGQDVVNGEAFPGVARRPPG